MRLLVLGGTGFVGPAVVQAGLDRGWSVTVFNRGRSAVPEAVTALVGDRLADGGLSALVEGEWDVVVDTWAGAPSAVRATVECLQGRVSRYVYVSSRSVYADPGVGSDETAPVVAGDPTAGEVPYPFAKRGAEIAVEEGFGEDAVLLRCGLILGPREDIGRLPWWLDRIARGGRVLAPGPAELPLQYVDARDLASFALEATVTGPVDVVSPSGHATMGSLLAACVEVVGGDAKLVWTDPEPILAAGVQPWTELPIWAPPGELHDAIHRSDVSRALGASLTCRPVARTVADTWAWRSSVDRLPQRPDRPPVGIDPAVEARLMG